jgi:uncharacterized protein (DUF3820 family)
MNESGADLTLLRVPVGKYKGATIKKMHTGYLHWWLTRDSLRQNYPRHTCGIIAELRKRYAVPGHIEGECLGGIDLI